MSSDMYNYGPKILRTETDSLPPDGVARSSRVKIWFADGDTDELDGYNWTIDDWSWEQHGFDGDIVAYAGGPADD